MEIQEFAIKFLEIGISILPVKPRDKKPDSFFLPNGSWEPFKTSIPHPAQVSNWFVTPHNYGVITGWQDLVVIDFDDMSTYRAWLAWASIRGGLARLVATSAFRVTSSRGIHVYVRIHNQIPRKLDKIDIKANGGYVLGPGSIHPSGAIYRAAQDVLNFPVVGFLSDILPVAILTQDTEPRIARAPVRVAQPRDVWEVLDTGHKSLGQGAVDRAKKQTRVEDYFPDKVRTSRDGRYYLSKCPFHDDQSPSFWLDTEQQICNCFVCNFPKPMDVIDLHARLYGLSNHEAIKSMVESK